MHRATMVISTAKAMQPGVQHKNKMFAQAARLPYINDLIRKATCSHEQSDPTFL
jgi:hypothetical protein